jgi:hypothetical protein
MFIYEFVLQDSVAFVTSNYIEEAARPVLIFHLRDYLVQAHLL